jgi:hypothetical protein
MRPEPWSSAAIRLPPSARRYWASQALWSAPSVSYCNALVRWSSFIRQSACAGPGNRALLDHLDTTRVRFRKLTEAVARRYVAADQPLDCAGSFKAERRGVILLESIDSRDPTAIQGLPLIWVAHALQACGVEMI